MRTLRWLCLSTVLFLNASLGAQEKCPINEEESPLTVKTSSGVSLFVCGFEDREVPSAEGKRAFTDFTIYSRSESGQPVKVFTSQSDETFWLKAAGDKGLELEELWFFSEQPKPALKREIACASGGCTVQNAQCVFPLKPNSFPRALASFEKKKKENQLSDDGEELLDQIWAQAITGDKAAVAFYQTKPEGLDPALSEIFESNKKKLAEIQALNCKR